MQGFNLLGAFTQDQHLHSEAFKAGQPVGLKLQLVADDTKDEKPKPKVDKKGLDMNIEIVQQDPE